MPCFSTIRFITVATLAVTSHGALATTLSNPPVTPASVVRWADSVTNLSRGPQNIAVANSPLASAGIAANGLGPQDGNTVSLGDGGSITLRFDVAIKNGAGADFAVFENAFGFNGLVFAELSYVEVSSDGANFARFTSTYNNPTANVSFGTGFRLIDIAEVNNFAGIHNTGVGTGFDLTDLADDTLRAQGLLDLDAIFFVRLIDVVGDGSTEDSFAHAILDPYPTALATGGFDLDAVGALQVVPVPPALLLLGSALGLLVGAGRMRGRRG